MNNKQPIVTEELSHDNQMKLLKAVKKLFQGNKGFLAADESPPTYGERFEQVGVENTEENRKRFRKIIFDAPELEKYINGVILNEEIFDETLADSTSMTDLLSSKKLTLGLKVDKGYISMGNGEIFTVGIEDLENRLRDRRFREIEFTKWRALFNIDEEFLPSDDCIEKNCASLARCAAICQKNGLVPILEPEINFVGCYSIKRMSFVAKRMFSILFKWLHTYNIYIPGTIFKISFITPGQTASHNYIARDMAIHTLRVIKESVPVALGGIVFLSGGHSADSARSYLEALKKEAHDFKIPFSFSFARALTGEPLDIWQGKDSAAEKSRAKFVELLQKTWEANKKPDSCNGQ